MSLSCLLTFEKDSLLRLTIASLCSSPDCELSFLDSQAKDFRELVDEIHQYSPDVILLATSTGYLNEETLVKLLLSYSKLSLVIINEDNNWVHIFRRNDELLTSLSDLLAAIKSR